MRSSDALKRGSSSGAGADGAAACICEGRERPMVHQRMPPMTGTSVIRIQTRFDAPRWRTSGCIAQSTMLTTQNAKAMKASGIRILAT